MKTIYKELANKFLESTQNPKLYKKFNFSREDLQDNPKILDEIADYLEEHKEKIADYRVLSWNDEMTFAPKIMLEMELVEGFKIFNGNLQIFEYFHEKYENHFDIIRHSISHEELMAMSAMSTNDEGLDYLIDIHGLDINKEKVYSIEVITEVLQEGKENKRLLKPQLNIKLNK